MALRTRRRPDGQVLDLFEEAGRNVQRSTPAAARPRRGLPRPRAAGPRPLAVRAGGRPDHARHHPPAPRGPRGAPFAASDGYQLATALDDIVDFAEQTADAFGIYHVEAPMEQADQLAEVLVGCGEQVALALRALRTDAELGPYLVEIHRLENEGDRISRDAVASLFHDGIDPIVVIRWKDIFEASRRAWMPARRSRTCSRGSRSSGGPGRGRAGSGQPAAEPRPRRGGNAPSPPISLAHVRRACVARRWCG